MKIVVTLIMSLLLSESKKELAMSLLELLLSLCMQVGIGDSLRDHCITYVIELQW